MDFDFNDDQEMLRDTVRKWVDKGYDFERRRRIVKAGGFERSVWGELADLGLTGLAVPAEHGGMGFGAVDAMVVMEELGRGLLLEPYAQGALVAGGVLASHAPAELQSHWLAKIASGEALVVLAHQERAARYRLDAVETRAVADGAGWRLTGTKTVVPAGDAADAFLVPARVDAKTGDAGIGLFLVERKSAGVKTRGYPTQDGSRAADLVLDGAAASLVAPAGSGLAAVEHGIDIGIAALCAEAVGAMEKLLAITAVKAVGSDDTEKVLTHMKKAKFNDVFMKNGYVRGDGRVIHDMYLMQVKSPEQSTEPWDYYKVVQVFKGEEAWTTKAESKCTLWK